MHVPALPAGTGWSVQQFSRRSGDFAIVRCSATLAARRRRAHRRPPASRLAGVDAVPVRSAGRRGGARRAAGVRASSGRRSAQDAAADLEPASDLHGSAAYRRHLAAHAHRAGPSRQAIRAERGGRHERANRRSVTVNGGRPRRGPSRPAGRSPTSSARTSGSPAPTSAASTACAAPARCCSTATPVRSCLMLAVQADGPRGPHHRGPGRRRAAAPAAAGAARQPQLPVRLLHAGLRDDARWRCSRRAPTPTEAEIREELSGNLCRCTGYQSIVDGVAGRGRPRTAAPRRRRAAGRGDRAMRLVGAKVQRVEDRRILTGRGRYVDDVAAAACCTPRSCAARSPHARITAHRRRGGPVGARRASPSTPARTWSALQPADPQPRCCRHGAAPAFYPLATDKVRFVGDPVAMVVADSRYLAEDAAELVEVDYDAAARRHRRRDGARPDACRRCSTTSAATSLSHGDRGATATSTRRSPRPTG